MDCNSTPIIPRNHAGCKGQKCEPHKNNPSFARLLAKIPLHPRHTARCELPGKRLCAWGSHKGGFVPGKPLFWLAFRGGCIFQTLLQAFFPAACIVLFTEDCCVQNRRSMVFSFLPKGVPICAYPGQKMGILPLVGNKFSGLHKIFHLFMICSYICVILLAHSIKEC